MQIAEQQHKLKPGAAGHKEERRLKWRRRLPGPSAHRPGFGQISDLHLQSPISNLDSGARGRRGAQTFKEMQFGFIHTDHLSSPISNLLLGHCRRRQQSTTSIFNLRSHIWGGWLGARIYNLHSPSPISTFWPCCCSERSAIHNLNLRSLVLSLKWGTGDRRERSTGERLGRVCVRGSGKIFVRFCLRSRGKSYLDF